MPCYSPQKAYRPLSKIDGGRLVYNSKLALNPTNPITLPCGWCIGCRADRAGDWAMRIHHEASMYEKNCFITLTYDDEHLPEDYSVHKRIFQLFNKRLRKSIPAKQFFRFYACGEYGDQTLRPHYHSIIFNYDFPDKQLYKTTSQDDRLYTSKSLEKIWPYGFCTIGDVTYQSAGYVARYVMKKITGDRAESHYLRAHPNGTIVKVQPEFALMSRRPGIGSSWFDKFKSDAFPSDFLVVDGKQKRVPQFYLGRLKRDEAPVPIFQLKQKTDSEKIKRKRARHAQKDKANSTPERLRVRKTVKELKLKNLRREL